MVLAKPQHISYIASQLLGQIGENIKAAQLASDFPGDGIFVPRAAGAKRSVWEVAA